MKTWPRLRSALVAVPFLASLVVLSGCGDSGSSGTTTVGPSEELKKSEASYEAEIAKEKAASKKDAAKK